MTEKELKAIDARIAELEAQSKEYERQIKELEKKKFQAESDIEDLETQVGTFRVLSSVKEVTQENSMPVYLYKSTRTTPIMSKFCSSGKKFLIIRWFMCPGTCSYISLVVTKLDWHIRYLDSEMTMTDLKQEQLPSKTHIKAVAKSGNTTRMSALYEELNKVLSKPIKAGDKIPFEHPVRLGGQTYSNQTGYGRTYYGYDDYDEGTLYGETTGFIIIGVLGEK